MKTTQKTPTKCNIRINQIGIIGITVLCDIYFNDKLLFKGIQNANYPIPLGTYKAGTYKGEHTHTRILLFGVPKHMGVEIHEANRAEELKGCTAIGMFIKGVVLFNSVDALETLVSMVEKFNVCEVTLSSSMQQTNS